MTYRSIPDTLRRCCYYCTCPKKSQTKSKNVQHREDASHPMRDTCTSTIIIIRRPTVQRAFTTVLRRGHVAVILQSIEIRLITTDTHPPSTHRQLLSPYSLSASISVWRLAWMETELSCVSAFFSKCALLQTWAYSQVLMFGMRAKFLHCTVTELPYGQTGGHVHRICVHIAGHAHRVYKSHSSQVKHTYLAIMCVKRWNVQATPNV